MVFVSLKPRKGRPIECRKTKINAKIHIVMKVILGLGVLMIGVLLISGCNAQSQCQCGEWADTDSDGIPDVTVEGDIVNIMGTTTVPIADLPVTIEPGFQCQGVCGPMNYNWQIFGPGGFNASATYVPAPIVLSQGDLNGAGEYVVNLEAHCDGQECLGDFKFKLIIENCQCGEWGDTDSDGIPDVTVEGDIVNITGTTTVPIADLPVTIEPGFQCQGVCGPMNYNWQIVGPGGFNASATYVPAPIVLSQGDLNGAGEYVVNLEAHCDGQECLGDFKFKLIIEGTPSIDVEKMVSADGGATWEDQTEQTVCQNVQFQITVTNDGDVALTNILITDHLLNCLEYVSGPAVNGICPTSDPPYYNLAGTDTPTWKCSELSPGSSVQITYTAHVVESGLCKNQVSVEGEYDGQIVTDVDIAYVTGVESCEPDMTFEKRVWDQDAQEWVEQIQAEVGTTVTFSITITNVGTCDLANVTVVDVLPDCLEYVQGSSSWANYLDVAGNELTWDFTNLPIIEAGHDLTIEFDAHIISEGVNKNCAHVSATTPQGVLSATDCATVTAETICLGTILIVFLLCGGLFLVHRKKA